MDEGLRSSEYRLRRPGEYSGTQWQDIGLFMVF